MSTYEIYTNELKPGSLYVDSGFQGWLHLVPDYQTVADWVEDYHNGVETSVVMVSRHGPIFTGDSSPFLRVGDFNLATGGIWILLSEWVGSDRLVWGGGSQKLLLEEEGWYRDGRHEEFCVVGRAPTPYPAMRSEDGWHYCPYSGRKWGYTEDGVKLLDGVSIYSLEVGG